MDIGTSFRTIGGYMELLRYLLDGIAKLWTTAIAWLSPPIQRLAGLLGMSLSAQQSQLIAALAVAMLIAWLVAKVFVGSVWRKPRPKAFAARANDIARNLVQISAEADALLEEMGSVINTSDAAVKQYERQLAELAAREEEISSRIDALNRVSIPAAQHFAHLYEKAERRSAWRDYALNGLQILLALVLFAIGLILSR